MEGRGHIFQRAAGVKVRRAPYEQMLAGWQDAVVVIPGNLQSALGFM